MDVGSACGEISLSAKKQNFEILGAFSKHFSY